MVKRIGSIRKKKRHILIKSKKEKGKLPVTAFLKQFNAGEKVVLKAEPSYHKGLFFLRFHGRIAVVNKKRGMCYEVAIEDGGKRKILVVNPVHLKKL